MCFDQYVRLIPGPFFTKSKLHPLKPSSFAWVLAGNNNYQQAYETPFVGITDNEDKQNSGWNNMAQPIRHKRDESKNLLK